MTIHRIPQLLLGSAFLIASSGYAYRSLQQANAYPQGPNVSLGSNPIEAFSFNCSSGSPQAFTTAMKRSYHGRHRYGWFCFWNRDLDLKWSGLASISRGFSPIL